MHLAQVNIGRLLHPIDARETQGFVDLLEPINALADLAPGFVWRLQTDDGDATAIRPDADDDLLAINLSVWESIEALKYFVYRTAHRDVMVQRRKWFEPPTEQYQALWWVSVGQEPTVDEALERVAILRFTGPTEEAFTFKDVFPPPR